MYPIYGKDTRSDNEIYLEEQLDKVRAENDALYRKREEEREERRRAIRESTEWDERHPTNWPQAFQSQANLCWREHNLYPPVDENDYFFKHSAEANEKALEIWQRIAESKKALLDDLQKQIDAVWESVRLDVANELEKSSDVKEYKWVASAIRDDQLSGYCDW